MPKTLEELDEEIYVNMTEMGRCLVDPNIIFKATIKDGADAMGCFPIQGEGRFLTAQ